MKLKNMLDTVHPYCEVLVLYQDNVQKYVDKRTGYVHGSYPVPPAWLSAHVTVTMPTASGKLIILCERE